MLIAFVENAERAERGASTGLIVACVLGAMVVAVIGRLVTNKFDRARIRDYAAQQGWELIDCTWKLFGPGWFGSSRARIYEIRFRDAAGRTHDAFAKTSVLAGVYLTQDRVMDPSAG
jgi:hypothetical protein